MDEHRTAILSMQVQRTMENLRKNNMLVEYVATKEEVVPLLSSWIPQGATVAVGGSVSLFECGVIDHLGSGRYHFINRYAPNMTPEEAKKVQDDTHLVDTFLCGSNAITEAGELYNVDGNNTRIGHILNGPRQVIMVVGVNKIVPDLQEAIYRVKTIAAPANCRRLKCNTFCAQKGYCASLAGGDKHPPMASGCTSDDRICSGYLVSAYQRAKDRIKIILVGEELGY